jgi:phage shock protein A
MNLAAGEEILKALESELPRVRGLGDVRAEIAAAKASLEAVIEALGGAIERHRDLHISIGKALTDLNQCERQLVDAMSKGLAEINGQLRAQIDQIEDMIRREISRGIGDFRSDLGRLETTLLDQMDRAERRQRQDLEEAVFQLQSVVDDASKAHIRQIRNAVMTLGGMLVVGLLGLAWFMAR